MTAKEPAKAVSETDKSINVFRIPHSRMKELVERHLRQVDKIENFSSAELSEEIDVTLQAVYQAMWELKSHEYIENHYIMDRLKARLQARRVYNQLVCNCHEDSKLLGVIKLVEKVYAASNEEERQAFGRQLKTAIHEFLKEFLHHMEEEEEVFQPLLNENFEAKELADMNEVVLKQHTLFREKVQSEKCLKAIKRKRHDDVFDEFEFSIDDLRFRKSYCQEVEEYSKKMRIAKNALASSSDTSENLHDNVERAFGTGFSQLPSEIILMIFRYLCKRDLLRSAQVCKDWRSIAFNPCLWKSLQPSRWVRGQWDDVSNHDDFALQVLVNSKESFCDDDETSDVGKPGVPTSVSKERRFYDALIRYLLPQIGAGVNALVLSNTRLVTDRQVRAFIEFCPNLVKLDLSYTRISDRILDGIAARGPLQKLETLSLEGCLFVTDSLLEKLRGCYSSSRRSKLRKLNLSGCSEVTSFGVSMLTIHQRCLEEIDLSGCYMLDGVTLTDFVQSCPFLRPDKISYCNDIEDGPYPTEANGCGNLECSVRFCCQQLKN